MITVIKHGIKIATAKCVYCDCEFTYNKYEDTKIEYEMNGVGCEGNALYTYVCCPECKSKHVITVNKK